MIARFSHVIALLTLITLIAFASTASAKETGKKGKQRRNQKKNVVTQAPDVPEPGGRRLREIAPVDGSFPILIGGSLNAPSHGTASETILNREFGFVTPGNEFKQTAIHPKPDVWRWTKSDDWVQRCEANDQIMRLHSPISPQCSKWARDDSRTGEELLQNLEEYLTEICKRYNGNDRIRWMDVVNETVTRDGEWFGPREGNTKWENPWTQIGIDEESELKVPLYIKRAFEVADQHAPDMKLILNQHGAMEMPMWKKVIGTVEYLKAQGVRIDGIGWQAHIDTGFEKEAQNMKNLNSLIKWAHKNDLEFHVTENTVWIPKGSKGTAEDFEAQAETFAAIVRTLTEHSANGVVGWNAWQMRDSETKRDQKGCMFFDDGSPKPAYYAVQKELENFRNEFSSK